MNIPTWKDAEIAVNEGGANPLEKFVFHNEPAGECDEAFRRQLESLICFVQSESEIAISENETYRMVLLEIAGMLQSEIDRNALTLGTIEEVVNIINSNFVEDE